MEDREAMHAANRRRWEAAARRWAECADNRGLWRRAPREPESVFPAPVLRHLRGLAGKRVCVLGSGDNQAVFALAGPVIGARVTSVDISQNQLDVAAARARELGLEVDFVRGDVTDLPMLPDGAFDLVYTGGHVAVWVADLGAYYREAGRILAPGGLFLVDEYHPFRRVWRESQTELVVENPYFRRGPYAYLRGEDVLYAPQGDLPSYEFHWTLADYLNAVIAAGCAIAEVGEYGEEAEDWEGAPMGGLPGNLVIAARKQG